MSYVGRNVSQNWINLVPQSATPSSPNEGDVFRSNGTALPEGLWEYRNGSWQKLGSDVASASIVVGDDSSFEGSIGSWLTYADAAAALPVDGTGGSPAVTFTRQTSAPLNGTASARLSKDAVNRQGQGASLLLDVPAYLRGQPVRYKLSYAGSANFGFGNPFNLAAAPSDVMVYAYDVTNAVLLTPYPNALSGGNFAEGSFQIASNCTQVRLILHIATTNALAWDLDVDNVELSLAENEYVSADSDWVSYTPTFTGFGIVTNINVEYRRNGPNLEIRGRYQIGTGTATEARISLPNGLVSSSTLTPTLHKVGDLAFATNSASVGYVLAEPSQTYLTYALQGTSSAGLTKQNGNVFASSTAHSIQATVPIQGWTSGTAHPASLGLNARSIARYNTAAGQSIPTTTPTIVNFGTLVQDSLGEVTTGASWRYTAKTPGWRRVSASVASNNLQTGVTHRMSIYKNGSLYSTPFKTTLSVTGTGRPGLSGSDLVFLSYGEFIDIRYTHDTGGPINLTSVAAENFIAIDAVGSEAQPYAPRIAYIKDVKASGTAGGTPTAGAYQTRVLNTLEGDTSFVSLASNQFTLQPGTYHIEAAAPVNGSANTVHQNKIKLRRVSGTASDIIIGQIASSIATPGVSASGTNALLVGTFSIDIATTFEIQHRVSLTGGADGYGRACSFGDSEVYTQVKITKVL